MRFPSVIAIHAQPTAALVHACVVGALFAWGSTIMLGCSADTDLELTEEDSGSQISVSTGESFTLRLDSNPSTGYQWTIDARASTDAIRLVASSFEAADTDAVGAGGTEVFDFEAVKTGAGVLRLTYERSFDDPPIAERVFELIVRVDDAAWPPDAVVPPGTSRQSTNDAVSVAVLLDSPADQTVSVSGFVVITDQDARLCQHLLESYPPQCGEPSAPIANVDDLTITLDQAENTRWTPNIIVVQAIWDGATLTLS